MSWLPFAGDSRPIGIDLGGTLVAAAQLSADGTRLAAAVELPRIARRTEPEREIQRVVRVLARRGFRPGPIVVGVRDADAVVAELTLPVGADEGTLGAIVADQLARMRQGTPTALTCAWWTTDRVQAPTRRSLAVGMAESSAESVADAFDRCGAEVVAIELRPLALARACRRIFADGLHVVLDRTADRPTVIVIEGGEVTYVRPLAPRSVTASDDLPSGQVAFSVDSLLAELRLTLGFLMHRHPQQPIDRLLLVGSDDGIAPLASAVRESLDITATPVRADQLIDTAPEAQPAGSGMVVALGLASRQEGWR